MGESGGLPEKRRRRILNYIFLKDNLRDIEDDAYRDSWGQPKTAERLERLANSLATFAKNAKKRPHDTTRAVAEWEEDLAYLKETFYDGWGDFPWPDVEV